MIYRCIKCEIWSWFTEGGPRARANGWKIGRNYKPEGDQEGICPKCQKDEKDREEN